MIRAMELSEDYSRVKPTRHRPGTAAKVRILGSRYSRGVPLFHPDDAGREFFDEWKRREMLGSQEGATSQ